jgi:Raf kinase inhibitor-like YbhB/YbcL family protein
MAMIYSAMGCTGDNRSPDLQWTGAPEGTKSYALTMFDPDAPTGVGFCHWVAYDIPAKFATLEAGADSGKRPHLHGGLRGLNDFGDTHYDGPCPPLGDPPHHYHLTIYALGVSALGLREGATYPAFQFAIRGLIAARGEIVGLYGRSESGGSR